jgi:UDP-glucose 4-epimerase
MMRALVTGGAGFIGSHVADALIARGYEVTVLDDLSGGFRDNVPAGARFVEGSITDATLVDRVFAEGAFDAVFHLAAYAAEGLSHFIKRFNYTNNVVGSATLISAAINSGVKCFVFTSSIAVYGASPRLPMTEDTPPHPEDPYGIAKLAVEQELRASWEMFGLRYVIFRPHNVFGPRQNIGDRYRNVVGIFMNQLLQGLPMTVFGDGTQTRAFSYIDDVAPIIARAPECEGAWNDVFNIGADRPIALNDLARVVARVLGVELRVEYLPPRLEVQHAVSEHSKVRRVFGDTRSTDLEEGLQSMAEWVRARGPRSTPPFEAIEIRKNLPAIWSKP